MKHFIKLSFLTAIFAIAMLLSCEDDKKVAVTGVSLNETTLRFAMGDPPKTLTTTVVPEDATNKEVTWTSSAPDVATVNNGVVTAVSVGTANITVTTRDGGKTASCAGTVVSTAVAVSGVTVAPTTVALQPGGSQQLTATVAPDNATNKNVTWSSNNTARATVSAAGMVTIPATATAGDVTITATTTDGARTAICTVTVTTTPIADLTVTVSGTYTYTGAPITPSGASVTVMAGSTRLTAGTHYTLS